MNRRNIGITVSTLIASFCAGMVAYNFVLNEFQTMTAFVIGFTGWLLVLLGEIENRA